MESSTTIEHTIRLSESDLVAVLREHFSDRAPSTAEIDVRCSSWGNLEEVKISWKESLPISEEKI